MELSEAIIVLREVGAIHKKEVSRLRAFENLDEALGEAVKLIGQKGDLERAILNLKADVELWGEIAKDASARSAKVVEDAEALMKEERDALDKAETEYQRRRDEVARLLDALEKNHIYNREQMSATHDALVARLESERKQLEDALAEAKSNYEKFLDSVRPK